MRNLKYLILLLTICFQLACSESGERKRNKSPKRKIELESENKSGNVVKIVDGDTYDIIDNGEKKRIRMEGIDAPERGMDYYKVSKEYLGELCDNQYIRLEEKEKDRYGRVIAKSFLPDGRELGEEMIRAGLAWHFKKYSSDEKLARLENEARASRIGLWSLDNPIPPWEYRKSKRKRK
jgi:micrococcal nuclease